MKSLFKINVFTYIFLILAILSGFIREMFMVFIILIIHELGHFFLMRLNGIEVNSITIYPYGGMIKSNMLINTCSLKVLLISLGGILSQLILFIIFYLLFKLGIVNDYYYDIFFEYNIYIMIFNLLPIYPLDGFKILNSLLEIIFNFKRSLYLCFIINLICLILFIVYLYIYRLNNYVIVLFLLLSLLKFIKEVKYIINKFYIERIIYDIKLDGLVSVYSINSLYKNKLNYINGVCEKEYLKKKYSIFI